MPSLTGIFKGRAPVVAPPGFPSSAVPAVAPRPPRTIFNMSPQELQGYQSGIGDQIQGMYQQAAQRLQQFGNPRAQGFQDTVDMYGNDANAYSGVGNAYGQIENQGGQLQFLGLTQEQRKAEQDLQDQLTALLGKVPVEAQQILKDLYSQRSAYQKASQPQLHWSGGTLYSRDPRTGKVSVAYQAPAKPAKPNAVNTTLSKALGYWTDSYGNPIKGITQPVPQPDAATPKINLGLSKALGYWSDSTGTPIPGLGGGPKLPSPKPVSPKLIAQGWKMIESSQGQWLSSAPGNAPLKPKQVRSILAAFNKKMAAARPAEQAAAKKAGKPIPPDWKPVTINDLATLSDKQLQSLGLSPNQNYRSPQQVYLDIVHSGVPARKAWQMVRKQYPNWGAGYFNPKADAPAGTGAIVAPLPTPLGSADEFMIADGPEGAPGPGGKFYHGGKDWFAPAGTNVSAPVTGKVIEVQKGTTNSGQVFGGVVKILASDGKVYVFRHVDPRGVTQGATVQAGTPIATVSRWTGGKTHAHVEIWKTLKGGYNIGNMIDPETVFSGGGSRVLASTGGAGLTTTPQGARHAALTLAAKKYGWGDQDLGALDHLWQSESGWDYKSRNKGSGALGIPQALGHTLPSDYASNPMAQIRWGLRYIKQRYGTPSRAWAFWQATVNKNVSLAPPDLRGMAAYWISRGYAGY